MSSDLGWPELVSGLASVIEYLNRRGKLSCVRKSAFNSSWPLGRSFDVDGLLSVLWHQQYSTYDEAGESAWSQVRISIKARRPDSESVETVKAFCPSGAGKRCRCGRSTRTRHVLSRSARSDLDDPAKMQAFETGQGQLTVP